MPASRCAIISAAVHSNASKRIAAAKFCSDVAFSRRSHSTGEPATDPRRDTDHESKDKTPQHAIDASLTQVKE